MRKILLIGALSGIAAFSIGCVETDYGNLGESLNKSHGIVDCDTNDREANSQQTVEAFTRALNYTTTYGMGSGPNCTSGFNPGLNVATVDRQDARDWSRFQAVYAFNSEAQVFGAGGGTWAMATVKDGPDGSRIIGTLHTAGTTGTFTCVGNASNGRYGGSAGAAYSSNAGNGIPANFTPGAISIDTQNGSQFCPNIAAIHPAMLPLSTQWSVLGRGGEGAFEASPVTRRAGLSEFFAGQALTVQVDDVSITASAELLEDGRVSVSILGLERDGFQAYQAGETPVSVTVRPSDGLRTFEVYPTVEEKVRLAQWAIDADMVNRPVTLGQFLPELGLQLPEAEFLLIGDSLQQFIDDNAGSGDDTPGFGG